MQVDEIKLSADILSALNNSETTESIVKSIDYTRPLNEYPTIDKIVNHLTSDIEAQHIYTGDINIDGVVVQDSMEKYLANEGHSSSMLKTALKTPLHYHYARSEDKEKLEKIKGTPDYFNIGTFLHQCLLEPTKFKRVIMEPSGAMNTTEGCNNLIDFWEETIKSRGVGLINDEEVEYSKVLEYCLALVIEEQKLKLDKIDGKRAYIKALREHSGVDTVSEENYIKIQILKHHIDNYGNGILYRLMKHSKREISVYWKDPLTGIDLKVRPDSLQFSENIGVNAIISVKSSSCEDLNAFFTQAAKMHYDLTEGMYQEVVSQATGRDFNTTITIMLQTVAPFSVAVLVWTGEDIETGKHKFRVALDTVSQIIEKKSSKGYDTYAEEGCFGLINMQLPQWNNKEYLPINI